MATYKVTATMYTYLTTTVEAETEEEALEIAQTMAENGEMTEEENTGDIDNWEAREA